MIDRGISEEYLVYWLDDACELPRDHIERIMSGARVVAHYGAGGRSLNQIYDDARLRLGPVLAAEYLRRALSELAEPTPVDDTLPPPDSPIWEWVYQSRLLLNYRAF